MENEKEIKNLSYNRFDRNIIFEGFQGFSTKKSSFGTIIKFVQST